MYNHRTVRKLIFVVILFLGMALVFLSFGELETIVETVRQSRFRYVFAAVIAQLIWFAVIGQMYRSIYQLLGIDDSPLILSLVAVAANFVNVIAPTAGVGGIALFAAEAKRRELPTGKATVAGTMFLLFDQTAFLCILAVGWIVLLRRNHLNPGDITASLILLAVACTLAVMLYLGYRSANTLGNILAKGARFINRVLRPFIHREYLREERAHIFAGEIADGLSGITQQPHKLLIPILFGLLNKTLLMFVLWCSFLAFEVPASIGTIIGGFVIGYLFTIVSPTPSGVGVMEGAMALALSSLGVVWSQAVIITLVYRGVTFWIPLGVGALSLRWLHLTEKEPASA